MGTPRVRSNIKVPETGIDPGIDFEKWYFWAFFKNENFSRMPIRHANKARKEKSQPGAQNPAEMY